MRSSSLCLLLALALPACSPWKIRYEPRSTASAAPTARKATRFLPEESQKLAQAGGKVLGALEIEGSGIVAERLEDLHNKAREEAARHGGTHFLHLDARLGAAELGGINDAFGVSLKSSDLLSGSKKALYLVVAVPREGWAGLPSDLQPLP
jgi:hypothetical protein